ncbi:hypothetical protein MCOR25_003803 [Pyricularia grisea]|nr:hypothetical protein MCOR25_003803 [Pyricularia grisea]
MISDGSSYERRGEFPRYMVGGMWKKPRLINDIIDKSSSVDKGSHNLMRALEGCEKEETGFWIPIVTNRRVRVVLLIQQDLRGPFEIMLASKLERRWVSVTGPKRGAF